MILLRCIFVVVVLGFLYYRIGVLYKKIIRSKDKDFFSTELYGFIINFAIFEILNIPFILFFKQATSVLYSMTLIISCLLFFLSYIFNFSEKNYNFINNLKNNTFSSLSNSNKFFFIFSVFLIIFQVVNSTFLFKQDADDSFYISWANQARSLENLYDMDPSTGLENSVFDSGYMFNTWEIYGGFIARVFNINVATLFHSTYPMLFIVLAYCSYFMVIRKVIKKDYYGLALFTLSFLFLFSGLSMTFKGAFLLGRIYQGKSIFLNIILPLAFYNLLNYDSLQNENIINLSVILFASIAFTVATFILIFLYIIFSVLILLRKDYKNFKKYLIVFVSILLVGLLYFIAINSRTVFLDMKSISDSFSIITSFEKFSDNSKSILTLYIICTLIVFLKGSKKQKDLSIYIPLIFFALGVNPLFKNVYEIAEKTYWRIFWLLPIEYTIIIGITIVYELLENTNNEKVYIIFLVITFITSGRYIYNQEIGFFKYENLEKIPQHIIDEAYYISENSKNNNIVVAPSEPYESTTLRQCSTKIKLLYSRDIYKSVVDLDDRFYELYSLIYYENVDEYNMDYLNEIGQRYDVTWIILPNKRKLQIDEKSKYEIVSQTEKNYILCLK